MGRLGRATLFVAATLAACAGRPPPELGVRDGRLTACPESPNCVSSEAVDARHRIEPLAFQGDPDDAWERLQHLVAARGDARVVDSGTDYLRVEFRTTLGFVDDAEFVLDREARVIQVRSASRVGYWDFGKNRSRIEELRAALQGREGMPGQPGR